MDLHSLERKVRARLAFLYAERAEVAWETLRPVFEEFEPPPLSAGWSQQDAVLITYGDMVRDDEAHALAAQTRFLLDNQLEELISTVHLLPFCPYSSDDGFSVIDYEAVDERVGDWKDVDEMAQSFSLMFDLVLNHCSQHSEWFQKFLQQAECYEDFFVTGDPNDDRLAQVTRPRSLPLLTEFDRNGEPTHVWTTFSDDQVDLNYADPRVLAEMVRVFLSYVSRGARIVRLDAIAFLWKEVGTTCLHLRQTHEVVKLLRDVVDELAPGVVILTETNVPHVENVSYFGTGDEAHMVYQFSLPPLTVDAFVNGDASSLNGWLANLEPAPTGCTYFNFTASHDGIGVRPLEGLVDSARIDALVEFVHQRGGRVGTRQQPDGTDTPYELNITYWDVLHHDDPELHRRRFLTSQLLMLSLRGVPGIYFHSLVGTPNDEQGVVDSGIPRRINRHKYHRNELDAALAEGNQRDVFDAYQHFLSVRRGQAAFHPEGNQEILSEGRSDCVSLMRTSPDGSQRVQCVANFSSQPLEIEAVGVDLLTSDSVSGRTTVPAFGHAWIAMDGA